MIQPWSKLNNPPRPYKNRRDKPILVTAFISILDSIPAVITSVMSAKRSGPSTVKMLPPAANKIAKRSPFQCSLLYLINFIQVSKKFLGFSVIFCFGLILTPPLIIEYFQNFLYISNIYL